MQPRVEPGMMSTSMNPIDPEIRKDEKRED
jgi:hypothetical protein